MNAPLLFLDIDGVLNTHDPIRDDVCGIHRDLVERLNTFIDWTGVEVVISSAWRYMILRGAMTLDGFRYMLMTHGLSSNVKLHGHTKSDEEIAERGDQIAEYLTLHGSPPYVIFDDGSELPDAKAFRSMTESLRARHGKRWIVVDARVGLRQQDFDDAITQYILQVGGDAWFDKPWKKS